MRKPTPQYIGKIRAALEKLERYQQTPHYSHLFNEAIEVYADTGYFTWTHHHHAGVGLEFVNRVMKDPTNAEDFKTLIYILETTLKNLEMEFGL